MDNTGNYISTARFLFELPNAGKGSKVTLVLSNKVNISGTLYEFDFASSGDDPAVGDFLVQSNFHGTISQVAGGKLRVDTGADEFQNGTAFGIKTEVTEMEAEEFILDAMAFIDRHTRQWFNKRIFDDAKPFPIEGNNSKTLFLPVPIIDITRIDKAPPVGETIEANNYIVFSGRDLPDDRRNPMIKLRKENDDVLFAGAGRWMRGVSYHLIGSFGFLEADGSTPRLIQRATLKLSIMYASKSVGEAGLESAASGNTGAVKREKTDMHEIEYYDPNAGSGKGSGLNVGTGLSGDDEVDDIIAAYKGPVLIEGTYPDFGHESPILGSVTGPRNRRGI